MFCDRDRPGPEVLYTAAAAITAHCSQNTYFLHGLTVSPWRRAAGVSEVVVPVRVVSRHRRERVAAEVAGRPGPGEAVSAGRAGVVVGAPVEAVAAGQAGRGVLLQLHQGLDLVGLRVGAAAAGAAAAAAPASAPAAASAPASSCAGAPARVWGAGELAKVQRGEAGGGPCGIKNDVALGADGPTDGRTDASSVNSTKVDPVSISLFVCVLSLAHYVSQSGSEERA